MEKYLGSTPKDYEKAKNIYSLGGNSGGYAEITLTTGLAGAHAKGVVVSQGTKTGTLKSAAAAGGYAEITLTTGLAGAHAKGVV